MAYERFVREISIEIGAEPTLAAQDAAAVVDLEVTLSRIKINKWFNVKSVDERTLASLYRDFFWLGLPQAIRALYGLANVTLNDDEIIVLKDYELTYFSQVKFLLQNCTERDLRNLFGYHYALRKIAPTENFFRIFFPLYQLVSGAWRMPSRAERCYSWVKDKIKHNIAREYIQRTFPEESKNIAVEMMENVRAAYNESLHGVTWMDDTTKKHAIEKLWAIQALVGYPDSGYSEDELDKRYEAWQFTLDNLFQNAEIFDQDAAVQMFRKKATCAREGWDLAVGPSEVNAYYLTRMNQAYVTAGILQPPLFSGSFHLAHNYGTIGAFIGHEIGHAFDPEGSQFDKFGNLHNWWDAHVRGNYTERTRCFVDQYENFTLPQLVGEIGYFWNGEQVRDEIIGDNNGLRQSYKAYRKLISDRGQDEKKLPGLNVTPDQLFFLAYSQVWCSKETMAKLKSNLRTSSHPPNEYRISGVLQNFPEFAQAYNCPLGSPMNPEKKCILF